MGDFGVGAGFDCRSGNGVDQRLLVGLVGDVATDEGRDTGDDDSDGTEGCGSSTCGTDDDVVEDCRRRKGIMKLGSKKVG
jgi:hypothetical protein